MLKYIIIIILLIISLSLFEVDDSIKAATDYSINITSPTSNSIFNDGEIVDISWNQTGIIQVLITIYYYWGNDQKSALHSFLIKTNESSASGSYQWYIPQHTNGKHKIEIRGFARQSSAPPAVDTIDVMITDSEIFQNNNPDEAFFEITSPKGGEVWYAGDTYTISWKQQHVKSITLVAKNGAQHLGGWILFNEDTESSRTSDSISWTIPINNMTSTRRAYTIEIQGSGDGTSEYSKQGTSYSHESKEFFILPIFAKKTNSQVCNSVYDPVCGQDNNTYNNECYATKEGVIVKHKGVCSVENDKCTYSNGFTRENKARQLYSRLCGSRTSFGITFDSLSCDSNTGYWCFLNKSLACVIDIDKETSTLGGSNCIPFDNEKLQIDKDSKKEELINSDATSLLTVIRSRIKRFNYKMSQIERDVNNREKNLVRKVNTKLRDRLKGKILLQVEGKGEAWYVDKDTGLKFYLKDGDTALTALRAFGLGITNKDLESIPVGIEERAEIVDADGDGLADKLEEAIGTDKENPDTDGDGISDGEEVKVQSNPKGPGRPKFTNICSRLEGKILLQIESKGEAWYIHNCKRYYMKNGRQAYQIMRFLSLGITNSDLRQIGVGEFE